MPKILSPAIIVPITGVKGRGMKNPVRSEQEGIVAISYQLMDRAQMK